MFSARFLNRTSKINASGAADPDFALVALLLRGWGNGISNASDFIRQNEDITAGYTGNSGTSVANLFPVNTAYPKAIMSPWSPIASDGVRAYCGVQADYSSSILVSASSASTPIDTALLSKSFTMECWVNATTLLALQPIGGMLLGMYCQNNAASAVIASYGGPSNSPAGISFNLVAGNLVFTGQNGVSYDGNSGYLTSGNSASVSASIGWHHLAITCAGAYGATGSTVRAFVDGNLICSLPWGAPAGYLGLDSPGWFLLNTSVLPVTGIRFIDNQCLATSNFLPPSTAPNGTQACWSNSTTSLTGTCLFLSSAKATSSTVDVGIIDASSNLRTPCVIGVPSSPVVSSTTTVPGFVTATNNVSVYFPSGATGLSAPFGQVLGTSNFTAEFWINQTVLKTVGILGKDNLSNTGLGWAIDISSNRVRFLSGTSTAVLQAPTANAFVANTWYHVAFVRYGGTMTLYINGINIGVASVSAYNWTSSTTFRQLYIGCTRPTTFEGTPATTMQGYLQDVRITMKAVYTSTFTPPVAPFPSK